MLQILVSINQSNPTRRNMYHKRRKRVSFVRIFAYRYFIYFYYNPKTIHQIFKKLRRYLSLRIKDALIFPHLPRLTTQRKFLFIKGNDPIRGINIESENKLRFYLEISINLLIFFFYSKSWKIFY